MNDHLLCLIVSMFTFKRSLWGLVSSSHGLCLCRENIDKTEKRKKKKKNRLASCDDDDV